MALRIPGLQLALKTMGISSDIGIKIVLGDDILKRQATVKQDGKTCFEGKATLWTGKQF